MTKRRRELSVQRVPDARVDYLRLGGVMDQTFDPAKIGTVSRPIVIDLNDVTEITSQGVAGWCDFIRQVPSQLSTYLVNVPSCVAAQIEYVPNFIGNAELVTVIAAGKCASCGAEQRVVVDLLGQDGGARCTKCGGALELHDVNLSHLSSHRARTLMPEVASLLEALGVYRVRARAQTPVELQKLVEGNANLLKMSGTLDEKFRAQRLVGGLEGTLLLEVSQLDVTPAGLPRFGELLSSAAKVCSQVVLVDLPYQLFDAVAAESVIVHSAVAPCYCSACDEIRQISLPAEKLIGAEPAGACPRCGRPATMIAGMVSLDRILPRLRSAPPDQLEVIGRFNELFSAAAVEAKLTSAGAPSGSIPQRIGPYRIVRGIARGGMADIYLAVRDDGLSKPVALKLLRREILAQARISLAMFLREARLNALLNHPNIVQVFDVDEADGNLYIVMEYLEGHALWRVFRRHGRPFPVAIAARIALQVLRALGHAHAARDSDGKPLSIVHRDVSPSNIVVGPDGNVKLIDFGIAIAGPNPDVLAGNPAWMSPEQFQGGSLDGRSDLFSVATVLQELLIGRQLFEGKNIQEIGFKVMGAEIAPVAGLPPALQKVLNRGHERDREQRFQTAGEFADALRAAVGDSKGEASEHEVASFVAEVMRSQTRPSMPIMTSLPPMPRGEMAAALVPTQSAPGAGGRTDKMPPRDQHTLPQGFEPSLPPAQVAANAAAAVAAKTNSDAAPATAPDASDTTKTATIAPPTHDDVPVYSGTPSPSGGTPSPSGSGVKAAPAGSFAVIGVSLLVTLLVVGLALFTLGR